MIVQEFFRPKTESSLNLQNSKKYKPFTRGEFKKICEQSNLKNECENLPDVLYQDVENPDQNQFNQLTRKGLEEIIKEQNQSKSDYFLHYTSLKHPNVEQKFKQISPMFNIINHREFFDGLYSRCRQSLRSQEKFVPEYEEGEPPTENGLFGEDSPPIPSSSLACLQKKNSLKRHNTGLTPGIHQRLPA